MAQDAEQRLEAAKKRLAQVRDSMVRAQGQYDTALNQLKTAYGYGNVQQAQAGYDRLVKEMPLMETKLNNLLNQAEEVLRGTEANTGADAPGSPMVGRQRSGGALQGTRPRH